MTDVEPPAQKAEKLSAAGVFERLLTYADTPWKAVMVLLATVIVGIGWIIWVERVRIADAVLNSAGEHATLDEAAFVAEAPRLLRDTRSDIVLLVELNLNDNVMIDRVGIDPDGNRWVPSTGPQQLLLPTSGMPGLVQFLSNQSVCMNTKDGVNDDIRALATKGFVRICMVAVPPVLGVLVGGLVVAWKQAPMPANESKATYAMRAAAMRFAQW